MVLGRNNVPVEIITPTLLRVYMHYTHSSNVRRICNVLYLFTMFNKRINKWVGFNEGYNEVWIMIIQFYYFIIVIEISIAMTSLQEIDLVIFIIKHDVFYIIMNFSIIWALSFEVCFVLWVKNMNTHAMRIKKSSPITTLFLM